MTLSFLDYAKQRQKVAFITQLLQFPENMNLEISGGSKILYKEAMDV